MVGYSGKSLLAKLGIKPSASVLLVGAPPGYAKMLGPLPEGAVAAKALQPAGTLWVSWPKKASGVPTDLTENVVREIALAGGLVDVKVCAVDDTWSGLTLVRRLKDR